MKKSELTIETSKGVVQAINSPTRHDRRLSVAGGPMPGAGAPSSPMSPGSTMPIGNYRYGLKTLKGCKAENQDDCVFIENFADDEECIFMGVFDGHGQNGKLVSRFVRTNLPGNIVRNPAFGQGDVYKALSEAFVQTNEELKRSPTDVAFSGSTGTTAFIKGKDIIAANVGDSRTVLGRMEGGKLKAVDLSIDHKPDRDCELARVLKAGGRVEPMMYEGEYIGPHRVWLKDQDLPGLATSRAFGDTIASNVGVVAEPELTQYTFDEADQFIICASDGVWEFLEN